HLDRRGRRAQRARRCRLPRREARGLRGEARDAARGARRTGAGTQPSRTAREWDVAVLEARVASTPPEVGLVRPIANLRDALNARISRGAFLYSLQHFRALQHDGYHLAWNRCGVLQLAGDGEEAERFAAIVRSQDYPPDFLQFVDAARASQLAGRRARGAGWWFPSGATVSPASLGVASLARAGERVRRRASARVERLEREGNAWRALDRDGRVLAEAPTLVRAFAASSPTCRQRPGASSRSW